MQMFSRQLLAPSRRGAQRSPRIAKSGLTALLCLGLAACSGERPALELLQRDLGFACDAPRIHAGSESIEAPVITITDQRGPMAAAGVPSGHVLATYSRCEDFYAELERSRGRMFSLTLVPGGDGLPIKSRLHQVLRLSIPEPRSKSP